MHPTPYSSFQDNRQHENAAYLQQAWATYQNKNYPTALQWLKRCHLNIMPLNIRRQYDNLNKTISIEQNNALMRQAAERTQNNLPFEALSLLEHCNLEFMSSAIRMIYDGHKHEILKQIDLFYNELIQQATRDANHRGQYRHVLDTIKNYSPSLMNIQTRDAFYSLQAHCFLQVNQPQQALEALQQLHATSQEQVTPMLLTCYRALGDNQNLIKTLTSIKDWHKNPKIFSELYQLVSYFQSQKNHLAAANILMLFPNWTSNESSIMQVARLYAEAARLLPETSVKRMALLQCSLSTYMRISNFNSRQEVLAELAPLHFIMGDYPNALTAYQAVGIGPDERKNKKRSECIQVLNAFFFILSSPTHAMQREHFTVLSYTDRLKKEGYLRQALDFYSAVPDEFKSPEVLRNQRVCQEYLGIYQASVVSLSSFRLPPSVATVAQQASAAQQETCYNAEQSHSGSSYHR
jgi:hypothetical protein